MFWYTKTLFALNAVDETIGSLHKNVCVCSKLKQRISHLKKRNIWVISKAGNIRNKIH